MNEIKLKLETINESLNSLEKDVCTCKGKMFYCNRCSMISDLNDEKIKLKRELELE